MGATTLLGLPYPENSDLVTNGAAAMKSLAEAVDANLGGAWTVYTPTLSPDNGAFTTATATGRYKQIGKLVHFAVTVNITTAGTATGGIRVGLPVSAHAAAIHLATGREGAATGSMVLLVKSSATIGTILRYDNQTVIASGRVFDLAGTYEAA